MNLFKYVSIWIDKSEKTEKMKTKLFQGALRSGSEMFAFLSALSIFDTSSLNLGRRKGLDKGGYQVNIFLISSRKHVMGTH